MKIFIKLYILLILLSINSIAQNKSISLSGIITDKSSGEVLIGTNLLLYKDSVTVKTPPLKGTATNQYGFYSFSKLNLGKYILVIRHIGYKTIASDIEILTLNRKVNYNISLDKEDVKLNEVIVTGESNNEVNISTIKISPKVLQLLPSISGQISIFKSLQLLPGIQVASEISNGLYIRGGAPDQNLTLVDGMMLYNPSHMGNFTNTFNTDAVQDIKLIKGAFPAEYGGRLGSVLDIKLRSGTREKTKGIVGLGTVNSFLSLEGPLDENSTFLFSSRGMYYDAILNNLNGNKDIPRYNFFDVNSKLTYNLPDDNKLSLSLVYSNDRLYSSDKQISNQYDIKWKNLAFNLNWLRILNKSTFSNTTFSLINYDFSNNIIDNPGTVSSSNYYTQSKITDISLKNNSELRWNDYHIAKIGIDLNYHIYDVISSNYFDYKLEKYPTKKTAAEVSVFIQNETNIDEILKINLGIRANYFTSENIMQFAPRFSLSYNPFSSLSIKLAAARTFQFIHLINRNDKSLPTDLWYPSGENIRPSESWQYVIGLEQGIANKRYVLSVEGYYRDMKNLYEFKNNTAFNYYDNLSDQLTEGIGEAYGIEFFLNKRIGSLKGWIGYTLSWSKRKFDEINNGKIFYPTYDRRHDISIATTYEISNNLSVGFTWVYSTGQRTTMASGQYIFKDIALSNENFNYLNVGLRNGMLLPDYHKLDINIKYKFNWGNYNMESYLNLLNVYNRQNVFSYYLTSKKENGLTVPVINQITLFPFLPTIGLKVNF